MTLNSRVIIKITKLFESQNLQTLFKFLVSWPLKWLWGWSCRFLDKHWDKLVIKSFLRTTVPFQFQQSEPQTILQMWKEISLPSVLALYSEFFLPILLRCNWYTALYKFKVYSIIIWVTYIMKWLSPYV